MFLHASYSPINPTTRAFIEHVPGLYINGQYVLPSSGETFVTFDPSTGKPLGDIPRGTRSDIDDAVQAARAAFDRGPWRWSLSPSERGQILWRFAEQIERHSEVLAQLDSLDNGKPVSVARTSDVPLAVEHLRYFAGWANKVQGATIPVNEPNTLNYTLREPIGVCALIVPWNYPLLMAVWKLAPALAAGNCIILKPAEQTSLSALYLGQLAADAGFPPGVFNVVSGLGEEAGAALTEHSRVDKVGFTGSTEVARRILHASTGNLKRVSLELGGKSPNIVFADADLSQAVPGATWAIFGNNGQSCTAGSRLYVERAVFEEVVDGVVNATRAITVGRGMAIEQAEIGPVVSAEQLDRVLDYVDQGVSAGAQAVAGGRRFDGALSDGYFVEPTIFVGAHDEMAIMREEIFGPVVCAVPFDDPDEVLARANASEYGLAAGLWTTDLRKAHHFAARLQAGTVWINTWGNAEASSPFGGYKQSGHGREMGEEAMALYSEVKSVWVTYG
ncbi:MAG: aldehyde dehydrogenase family protein [Chloroflexi bacterium]|nr:aldehyde dehydrogenase family protein [Chloroflexota bacterium]